MWPVASEWATASAPLAGSMRSEVIVFDELPGTSTNWPDASVAIDTGSCPAATSETGLSPPVAPSTANVWMTSPALEVARYANSPPGPKVSALGCGAAGTVAVGVSAPVAASIA
jgi:hypothetical protein